MDNEIDFRGFPKIARYSRRVIVTEKIDGTNAQIFIGENGEFLVGSRTRWITPDDDNHGFAQWCMEHKQELLELGPGRHFGEWWGYGINRGYGLKEKRFSLFNTYRWAQIHPKCCDVVPILFVGDKMDDLNVGSQLQYLKANGSYAAPGFMNPEGIVIYHTAANIAFKKTLADDDEPKSIRV